MDTSELTVSYDDLMQVVDGEMPFPLSWRNREDQCDFKKWECESLFHVAVENSHLELIEYLVSKGVNIRGSPSTAGITCLHSCSDLTVMRRLIELGADINAKNCFGTTPATTAIFRYRNIKFIRDLLNPLGSNDTGDIAHLIENHYKVEDIKSIIHLFPVDEKNGITKGLRFYKTAEVGNHQSVANEAQYIMDLIDLAILRGEDVNQFDSKDTPLAYDIVIEHLYCIWQDHVNRKIALSPATFAIIEKLLPLCDVQSCLFLSLAHRIKVESAFNPVPSSSTLIEGCQRYILDLVTRIACSQFHLTCQCEFCQRFEISPSDLIKFDAVQSLQQYIVSYGVPKNLTKADINNPSISAQMRILIYRALNPWTPESHSFLFSRRDRDRFDATMTAERALRVLTPFHRMQRPKGKRPGKWLNLPQLPPEMWFNILSFLPRLPWKTPVKLPPLRLKAFRWKREEWTSRWKIDNNDS